MTEYLRAKIYDPKVEFVRSGAAALGQATKKLANSAFTGRIRSTSRLGAIRFIGSSTIVRLLLSN